MHLYIYTYILTFENVYKVHADGITHILRRWKRASKWQILASWSLYARMRSEVSHKMASFRGRANRRVCVAVCCRVLSCVAACCSVLQCVAGCCSEVSHTMASFRGRANRRVYILQHTATHGNTLKRAATHCNKLQHKLKHTTVYLRNVSPGAHQLARVHTLQHTTAHYNTLQHTPQHTATYLYNTPAVGANSCCHCRGNSRIYTLQHAAIRCNILQHIPQHSETLTTTLCNSRSTLAAGVATAACTHFNTHCNTHCNTLTILQHTQHTGCWLGNGRVTQAILTSWKTLQHTVTH